MDEFSFKKMRMLGQPVISSCCLCVRCKSRELGDGVGVAGESKIPGNNGGQLLCSPSNSYRKILDRLTFTNSVKHQWQSSSVKVCGALLGDGTNGGYADSLLYVWWAGFSSLGSCSYSEEWVWTSGSKLGSIVPGKWNVSKVAFPEFNIRYWML